MSRVTTRQLVDNFINLGYIVSNKRNGDHYVLYKRQSDGDKYITILNGQVIHKVLLDL